MGKSIAEERPDLLCEWDYEKNGLLQPTDVTCGSHRYIWWKCKNCGYSWQAVAKNRVYGNGCPACAGKIDAIKKAKENRGRKLSDTNPELSMEWHPTLNGNLSPSDVTYGSKQVVWWKCQYGHEWQAKILNRVHGNGCPQCRAASTSYGEQYIYWALKQLFPRAINRYKTSNNVEYDIAVPEVRLLIEYSGENWHVGKEERDAYKKRLAEENNFRFVQIIENERLWEVNDENYYTFDSRKDKDDKLTYIIGSIIKAYEKTVSELDMQEVRKNAIEYSKGTIEYEKTLEYLYPDIAKEWHPTLNKYLTAADITPGSNKNVWWKCTQCGHEWSTDVNHRTSKNFQRGCPKCANLKKAEKLSRAEDGASLMDLNCDIAVQWHPTLNGYLRPVDIKPQSNKKVWWLCDKGHSYEMTPNQRVSRNRGCPYCSGNKVLQGYNDLSTTEPNLAKEWHPTLNGELRPTDISRGSGKKVWWKCSKGHEWIATVNSRSNGNGCPYCSGKKRMIN